MIRIDAIWLATEPLDMRAGPETALSRVVQVFGEARPHCAYLFANKRGNRMKVLVHDGLGLWLCARRLHQGRFHWGRPEHGRTLSMNPEQLQALVQGLPWAWVGESGVTGSPERGPRSWLVPPVKSAFRADVHGADGL